MLAYPRAFAQGAAAAMMRSQLATIGRLFGSGAASIGDCPSQCYSPTLMTHSFLITPPGWVIASYERQAADCKRRRDEHRCGLMPRACGATRP
jgi:hypothetical protein